MAQLQQEVKDDQLVITKVLGQGSFGIVYKGGCRTCLEESGGSGGAASIRQGFTARWTFFSCLCLAASRHRCTHGGPDGCVYHVSNGRGEGAHGVSWVVHMVQA